ncbi:MAG TPA: conjugal transfer protein TrbC, partial [Novosphingobium sp.]|nr:conjugal transfer protein TrbC [Novosphingobium sp.]
MGATASAPPPETAQAQPENARTRIQDQGADAMERVKRAVGKAKATTVPSPVLPAKPDTATQRRAFEGFRRRKTDSAIVKRAEADVAAAREALAAERETASRRVAQALGLQQPEAAALAGVVSAGSEKGWVPMLFVSSSMPVATLRT